MNFIAFDIGTSKISAVVARVTKDRELAIIATKTLKARGFASGIVTDREVAIDTINQLLYELEHKCNINIKEVYICLPGNNIKSYFVSNAVTVPGAIITAQDIKKMTHQITSNFKVQDQDIIDFFPIEFELNDSFTVSNPIGMYAKKISCEYHVITACKYMITNINSCFADCKVEVQKIYPSSHMSAISCLTDNEKDMGAILIEIGSTITSYAIVYQNKVIYSGYIRRGGYDITRDIMIKLSLNFDIAEKLKILCGDASSTQVIYKNDLIRLEDFLPNELELKGRVISITDLTKIIRARMKNILLEIEKEYKTSNTYDVIGNSVVLSGGGALLHNLKNLCAEILDGKKIRIADIKNYATLFKNIDSMYPYQSLVGIFDKETREYFFNNQGVSSDKNNILRKIIKIFNI